MRFVDEPQDQFAQERLDEENAAIGAPAAAIVRLDIKIA